LEGVAQFLIEGHSIAAEFARLDQRLLLQALVAFAAGGGILAIVIGWAFRRLRRAHRLLAERTTDLLQANQELALAAKTSAVGAVTAHLIHGLKSPLTGLQNFMAGLSLAGANQVEAHWQEAAASARRMQVMINQVVNVLREEEGNHRYEITLPELVQIVSGRMEALARERGVHLATQFEGAGVLVNRTANLAALILINLIQNALQATPAGKTVKFVIVGSIDQIACEVRDEGPGFPEALKKNLFAPCPSTKEGGCGIGLAISKQLANHLGAGLEMKTGAGSGCVFALTLPVITAAEKSVRAAPAPVG
jgi:signal transduction histidine kinase